MMLRELEENENDEEQEGDKKRSSEGEALEEARKRMEEVRGSCEDLTESALDDMLAEAGTRLATEQKQTLRSRRRRRPRTLPSSLPTRS